MEVNPAKVVSLLSQYYGSSPAYHCSSAEYNVFNQIVGFIDTAVRDSSAVAAAIAPSTDNHHGQHGIQAVNQNYGIPNYGDVNRHTAEVTTPQPNHKNQNTRLRSYDRSQQNNVVSLPDPAPTQLFVSSFPQNTQNATSSMSEPPESSECEIDYIRMGDKRVPVEKIRQAIEYYRSAKKGKRTLRCMSHRFRFITNTHHMKLLLDYEKNGECKLGMRAKQDLLGDKLLKWVHQQQAAGIPVYNTDLQNQGIKINEESVHIDGFKAGAAWLARFKKDNSVVTTHATKKASDVPIPTFDEIQKISANFVQEIKRYVSDLQIPLTSVVNAVGYDFKEEIASYCKEAFAHDRAAMRSNGQIYNFVIVPMLLGNGQLSPKLYVILSEAVGTFPNHGYLSTPNLIVRNNPSYLYRSMTTQMSFDWFATCITASGLPDKMVVLVDDVSGFKERDDVARAIPVGKTIKLSYTPNYTGDYTMPLKQTFTGLFASFIRRIVSFIENDNIGFDIYQRDNIVKLLSVAYHQFCAEQFQGIWKTNWSNMGYTDPDPVENPPSRNSANEEAPITSNDAQAAPSTSEEQPDAEASPPKKKRTSVSKPRQKTPLDVCFSKINSHTECSVIIDTRRHTGPCTEMAFAMCAHCSSMFCIEHFIVKPHYC